MRSAEHSLGSLGTTHTASASAPLQQWCCLVRSSALLDSHLACPEAKATQSSTQLWQIFSLARFFLANMAFPVTVHSGRDGLVMDG